MSTIMLFYSLYILDAGRWSLDVGRWTQTGSEDPRRPPGGLEAVAALISLLFLDRPTRPSPHPHDPTLDPDLDLDLP